MTEQVITHPKVGTSHVKPSVGKRMLRFAVLIGVSAGLAIGLNYGIESWQEYQWTQRLMGETEAEFEPFTVENPLSPKNFSPPQVVSPFSPITDVPVSTVKEAEAAEQNIENDELVLGIVVNDEARAYPLSMMSSHSREIMNDTLGGRAIAATW